ncbi:hypothetical protein E2P64_00325 [Candidatus Bathyarchaeota archaeon]|nr:hypothetical protein E2P64_00325 [Candidatus Bathyarchaeota archaeon]
MRKFAILLLLLLSPGFAKVIIANSKDWRFVLLTQEYAHYQGGDVVYLMTEAQADLIAQNLAGDDIIVFEDSNSIVDDYDQYIKRFYNINSEKKDFKDYRELQEYLLRVLTPETLFVASNIEPENTLISVPIAYKKEGVVLFSSSSLFSRLPDFDDIYLVGGVQRDYRRELLSVAALLEKDVNIIDFGSPYFNSLALLDEWGKTDKLYLSTGEFLHPTIFTGNYPLVLVGKTGYHEDFIDTLNRLGVQTVFAIGTDLMEVASRIRTDSNREIATFVEFAETYTSAGQAGTTYALTVYPIPVAQPNITVTSVFYDPETTKLYVKFANYGDGLAYVAAITRISRDGETQTSITDDETFLLWPGDELVRVYSIDLSDYGVNNLDAVIDARYGRYEDFLVNILDMTLPITVTRVIDKSSINVERATYDGTILRVYVKNNGGVIAFVSGQIALLLDGDTELFQLSGIRLAPTKVGVLQLRIRMDETDLDNNQFVDVFLKYGERQDLLVNTLKARSQLEIIKIRLELLAMPVLALLLILLLMSVVSRMRRRRYYRAGRRIKLSQRRIIGVPMRRSHRRIRR